jgi:hypothetical protein
MAKDKLVELAERCEAATRASLDLDNVIAGVMGVRLGAERPRYTASLDAALALVLDGWAWMVGCDVDEPFFATLVPTDESGITADDIDTKAATPALALCAAALRSHARHE